MPSSGFVPFISSLAKPSENIHLCHSSSSSSCRCLSGGVHTGVYSHSHTHTHTHTHTHRHIQSKVRGGPVFQDQTQNHASTLDHLKTNPLFCNALTKRGQSSRSGRFIEKRSLGVTKTQALIVMNVLQLTPFSLFSCHKLSVSSEVNFTGATWCSGAPDEADTMNEGCESVWQ